MKRGDVVICAVSGDYCKPRPAVVLQSDLFNPTHASIVVCPITSHLVDAPLFRLQLEPSQRNGLLASSQIMVDKLIAIKVDEIHAVIGDLVSEEIQKLDSAVKLWLGLGM